jgi:hypothetical protein
MFGRKDARSLTPPPNAKNPAAVEILRVWVVPGEAQQVVLEPTWQEPGVWGLLLADLARHAAKAYANNGLDEQATLARICQFLESELASPTDSAKQI